MSVDSFIKQFLREQRIIESINRINRTSERIRAEAMAKDGMPRGKALDALFARSTRLHLCSDGCYRSDAQIVAWKRNGRDHLSDMRADLKKKHCSSGNCSTRPGHICGCK